jgi:hypothetical protein
MVMLCPYCGKEEDNVGGQMRFAGLRWHLQCWLPWLEDKLKEVKKET